MDSPLSTPKPAAHVTAPAKKAPFGSALMERLFDGPGEMRSRLRQVDWSKTPLGPVPGWPLMLRAQVWNCLNTRFAVVVMWGPELTMIYNDAYIPIFGQKHPAGLAQSLRVVWAETWPVIGVQVDAALERGESTWNHRVLIPTTSKGVLTDFWYTFSMSPLIGDTGEISGLTIIAMDETEGVRHEKELVETRDRLALTLSAAEIGFWSLNARTGLATADANLAKAFSLAPEVVAQGAPLEVFIDAIYFEDRERTLAAINAAMANGLAFEAEYRLTPQKNLFRWVIARGQVVRDEAGQPLTMSGVLVDVTERKRIEQLAAAQNEVLQLVASDMSLPQILEKLVRHVETPGSDAVVASILLIDREGRLRHGAAPGLPDAYNQAVDGIAIGENVGTCGRAAFLRETVITPDLATDPNWEPLRQEAAALNLQAAWSAPIIANDGRVLGTFGTYFREKREPTDAEMSTVGFLAKTAALVIEQAQAKDVLRESEERFRTLADNISQFAWMADGTGSIYWYNQRWFAFTGTNLETMQGWGWQKVHHPDHVDRVTEKFQRHVQDGTVWEDTFPLRGADGEYRWFLSRAIPIRDARGAVVQWFGTNTDITEQRQSSHAGLLLASIVSSSDDAIVSKSLDGIITSWNDSAERVFGYTAAEAIGQHVVMLVPADRKDEEPKILARLRRGERVEHFETIRVRKNGELFPASLTISPIRDESGTIIGASKIARDITALRAAQAELRLRDERFRQIADTMPQIVWGAGTDGVLDYYNRRWFEYIQKSEADMAGAQWDKYIHPEDLPATYETWMAALASGQSYQAEFRVRRADGDYRWFLTRALPIHDAAGNIVRWFGTCTDIHDRKALQEESLLMIERERAARVASEEAGRMKDEFLARLSHELRTPLNPVLLLASESAANEQLPADVRADFGMIAKNVALESRLIDDLLDLTRITRGKMALTVAPADLHGVLQDAIANVGPDLEAKHLQLITDFSATPAIVVGDAVRLQQVFWNILRNAAKFTPADGLITVTTALVADGRQVEVRISDTGMGMNADEQGRLFNAFVQGDHAGETGSKEFGGLGLGLAISRMLVELHSGRITGTSEGPGKGSTFTVQLPAATPARAGRTAGTNSPIPKPVIGLNSRASRILLVEDHEPTRTALTQLLVRRHYDVVATRSVEEALANAEKQKFDLLITDIGLPDGDGYEIMRALRQSQHLKGIALTGYGMQDDIERSHAAGFAAHLTKPITIQSLEAALASVAAVTSKS